MTTSNSSKEKEKVALDCEYPMCPAAKDRDFEKERHEELKDKLDKIDGNHAVIASEVRNAVLKLEKIAVIFSEQTHIKEDLNKLGDKIRHLEEVVIMEIRNDIKGIGRAKISWQQTIIVIIISGPVFGIAGFLLHKLWG